MLVEIKQSFNTKDIESFSISIFFRLLDLYAGTNHFACKSSQPKQGVPHKIYVHTSPIKEVWMHEKTCMIPIHAFILTLIPPLFLL